MAIEKKNSQGMDAEEMLSRSETFIEKNKKAIIAVIVLVVLIIVGVVLYKNYYKEPKEKEAAAALFKGESYFQEGNYELAMNGDSVGWKGFAYVINEYGGTDAGNMAKAYAGISLSHLGKYEEAIKYLEDYSGKDKHFAATVEANAANCYANLGQLEKAAPMLVKAADKSQSQALSPIWLKQAGQIYEKLGNKAEALKCYQKVKDNYFANQMISADIDKYIERVSE